MRVFDYLIKTLDHQVIDRIFKYSNLQILKLNIIYSLFNHCTIVTSPLYTSLEPSANTTSK